MKIVIVGAGIAGLSAAWQLQHAHEVILLEASDRVGGWIRTHHEEGAIFECGPRSLRFAEIPSIIGELGLELVQADASDKYLAVGGALEKLPSNLVGALFSEVGRKSLWGMLRYLFSRKIKADTSVQSHFEKSCGADFVDAFIDPLMAGIWAESPSKLSYQACFPKRKKGAKVYSIKGGLQALPDAIAARVRADIRLNTRVEELKGTRVKTNAGWIEADRVICTVGALVPGYRVPQTSLVTVSLGYVDAKLSYSGFGFLASSKEECELLGIVFDSELFPTMNGGFRTRLSVMMGGGRAPAVVGLSDAVLREKAEKYVRKYLGIEVAPDVALVSKNIHAIPAFPVGYLAERERLVIECRTQGIELAGAQFYNPSIADILAAVWRV